MDMGLLTREQMISVFGKNFAVDFFHLDARYFPEVTRQALPIELILQSGALPLGLKTEFRWFRKRKILNLGLLDPSRKDLEQLIHSAKALATDLLGEEIHDVKLFLILADQFLEVLDEVYQVSDSQMREKAAQKESALDGTLQMFIETQSLS